MPKRITTARAALDVRQAAFCREYVIDFNAARAARDAGYSPSSIRGYLYAKLMRNAAIRAEMDRLIAERAERTLVTADRVVLELAAVAFSNVGDYTVDGNGDVVLDPDADQSAMRAVKRVRKRTRRRGKGADRIEENDTEIRLWDKLAALRLLMLHTGLLGRKLTIAGDSERPVRVEEAREARITVPADLVILSCLERLGLLPAVPNST